MPQGPLGLDREEPGGPCGGAEEEEEMWEQLLFFLKDQEKWGWLVIATMPGVGSPSRTAQPTPPPNLGPGGGPGEGLGMSTGFAGRGWRWPGTKARTERRRKAERPRGNAENRARERTSHVSVLLSCPRPTPRSASGEEPRFRIDSHQRHVPAPLGQPWSSIQRRAVFQG